MKITLRQLRQLINEMVAPPVEFMYDMIDIGSPMVKQLSKYLLPFKDKINFRIKNDGLNINIYMYYENLEVGYLKSNLILKSNAESNQEKINLFTVNAAFINVKKERGPELFRMSGFGPILYEICLETVSILGENYYLTCDRSSLQPDAYNVWAFYFYNRNDVEKKQLDNINIPHEYSITNNPNLHYDSWTSEDYYETLTNNIVWPQGPGDDEKETIKNYVNYAGSKDPLMKAYRKNLTPFIDFIKYSGIQITYEK